MKIQIDWGMDIIDGGVTVWTACDGQLHIEQQPNGNWAWCVVFVGDRDRETGVYKGWPCGEGETHSLEAAKWFSEAAFLQALASEAKAEGQLTEAMEAEANAN